MLDRERILAKFDELDGYLQELRQVVPASFADYMGKVETRRACERLLQLSVQCVLDICALFVSGLRLGLPAEEDDLFEKLERAGVLSSKLSETLKTMKGFRNILVHEYGAVDNAVVYKMGTTRFDDFQAIKKELLHSLQERAK